MSTIFQLPVQTTAQVFSITLSSVVYTLTIQYRNDPNAGWILDIGDVNNTSIVTGIPLVTGVDLLEQYAYLGFVGGLYVQTTTDPDAVPTFDNLGTDGQIYYVTS